MTGLDLLIGALALLVTVLLFGFVGCNWAFGLEPTTLVGEDYPAVITGTSGLVAYWRLGEPDSTQVPSSGGMARSEVGGYNGDYFKLNPVTTPDDQRHAPATAGTITLGITPGLLERTSQTTYPCIDVDGGFVQVPFDDNLNPQQFTFEAWVSPHPSIDPRYYYCLAESAGPPGPQGLGQKKTGWGLYLGPQYPNNPAGPPFWQVWMGDGNNFKMVAMAKPDFPTPGFDQLRLTYLALTFDGAQKLQLFLYFPDTKQPISFEHLQALVIPSSINFQRNDTTNAGKGDFVIGAGSNLPFAAGPPSQRLYPFKGKIQEVALYDIDLSAPDNAGVQSTLASHETSGGNL